jgi:hypothetical protein
MKLSKSIFGAMVLICFLVLGMVTVGRGEVVSPASQEDSLQSFGAFYLWIPAITGDVSVKGIKDNISTTYADTFNKTKFYYSLHYEGFNDRWGIMFDGLYSQLEWEKDHAEGTNSGRRQFNSDWSLIELAIPYRVNWSSWVADVFVGARYNFSKQEVSIPSRGLAVNASKQWLDPFVGGRVIFPILRDWYLGLRADIGGFGIGNAADLVLNASGFVYWQINRLVSLSAGYRAYYLKYNDDDFEWNATTHGPWIGVGFIF